MSNYSQVCTDLDEKILVLGMQGSIFRFKKAGRGFYLKLRRLANPALGNW